ncbi:hypothetical protein BHE74_00013012 [Ensete ventricosum]|uniref:Uncharacterized protein n=1 Tax=Ensete ventricosum TaxID=4639 RepID=A0A444E6Y9_ENSVE|nr:hypothetical protein GW17_00030563 [Ensete ventricosum]RWW78752.1 hypothetical protein BHE74_00013012 [Ensete ventricosum]RZR73878.1 hypothetical protein BHM03_00029168 [Ensete ventricosum]
MSLPVPFPRLVFFSSSYSLTKTLDIMPWPCLYLAVFSAIDFLYNNLQSLLKRQ